MAAAHQEIKTIRPLLWYENFLFTNSEKLYGTFHNGDKKWHSVAHAKCQDHSRF